MKQTFIFHGTRTRQGDSWTTFSRPSHKSNQSSSRKTRKRPFALPFLRRNGFFPDDGSLLFIDERTFRLCNIPDAEKIWKFIVRRQVFPVRTVRHYCISHLISSDILFNRISPPRRRVEILKSKQQKRTISICEFSLGG